MANRYLFSAAEENGLGELACAAMPTNMKNSMAFDGIWRLKSVRLWRRIEKIAPIEAMRIVVRSTDWVRRKLRKARPKMTKIRSQNITAGRMPHSAVVSR